MTKLTANRVGLPRKLDHAFHPHQRIHLCPEDGVSFKCDGCKLKGSGARYECRCSCKVDLHIGCTLAPPVREIGGSPFVLLHEPPKSADGRLCDACGKGVRGFVYHSYELDHDLHPLCAEPFELADLSFELCWEDKPGSCVYCDKEIRCPCRSSCRRRAWYYRCDAVSSLHVVCAKKLASKGFANVKLEAACDKALAYASSKYCKTAAAAAVCEFTVSKGKDTVTVSAEALRKLLLKRPKKGAGRHGGALGRSLRVLGFIVRVVFSVVFGNPMDIIRAVAEVVFSETPTSSSG